MVTKRYLFLLVGLFFKSLRNWNFYLLIFGGDKLTNITTISPSEVVDINFAINKLEEIRENINCNNQENRSKDDLVTSILDIEEVLAMVVSKLENVIKIKGE